MLWKSIELAIDNMILRITATIPKFRDGEPSCASSERRDPVNMGTRSPITDRARPETKHNFPHKDTSLVSKYGPLFLKARERFKLDCVQLIEVTIRSVICLVHRFRHGEDMSDLGSFTFEFLKYVIQNSTKEAREHALSLLKEMEKE